MPRLKNGDQGAKDDEEHAPEATARPTLTAN